MNLTAITELKKVTDGEDYTFSAAQVIASSVRNFIQHGFSDNGVADFSSDIVSHYENTLDDPTGVYAASQLQKLFNIDPNFAGIFGLPVCVTRDVNTWPMNHGTPGRLSASAYCPCGKAVDPDAVDKNGKAFSDAASRAVEDITKYVEEVTGRQDCYLNGF